MGLLTIVRAGLLAAAILLSYSPLAHTAPDAEVMDIRVGEHGLSTRIVVDVDRSLDAQIFALAGPARLVVDLPEVGWRLPPRPLPSNIGVLSRLRYGLFKPGNSRIVIDLNQPSRVHGASFLPAAEGRPGRLVIDLARASGKAFLAAVEAPPLTIQGIRAAGVLASAPRSKGTKATLLAAPAKPSAPVRARTQKPTTRKTANTELGRLASLRVPLKPNAPGRVQKRIIVIDPGHGGVDPGAIGISGIYEKHVTLAAARDLKKHLEKTGRFRVYLTRDRDIFIRLRDRVEIAGDKNADLFVSLHADSIRNNSKVRGLSVYTLSERASDKEAAELAERENKADLIAGIDLTHESAEVTNILIDLAQRETMNQSARLASILVDEMRQRVRVLRNPHRFAGFAVLKAPDIPSVLIELGFLSNRQDEKALKSKSHRRKLAQSIAAAVDKYFARVESASR